MTTTQKKRLTVLGSLVAGIVLVNVIGQFVFARFDLTADKRYTLSNVSLDLAENITDPLTIKVFLNGTPPGEFQRLETETRQLLEEFQARNRNIRVDFVNPIGDGQDDEAKKDLIFDIFHLSNRGVTPDIDKQVRASINKITDLDKALFDSFYGSGMKPVSVSVMDHGKKTEAVLFPWAILNYRGHRVKVPLLKNMMTASTQENINSSVQHLEYAFANGLQTATERSAKKIAVIKGNAEIDDILMADFLRQVRDQYHIGTFTLDSVAKRPKESADYLKKNYDLAIIAKPKERFTDEEIQVLDDYVMHGGRTLWLVDPVHMELDSLAKGPALAFPIDLNLNNLFFKYGVRIQPELIKDEYAAEIKLATGDEGSGTRFSSYIWRYSPVMLPTGDHPIVKNVEAVRFDFASPIELLKNDIKKTVLLQSSPFSKAVGVPAQVSFEDVAIESDPKEYQGKGNLPAAVLLEGRFHSIYENRVLPFDESDHVSVGKSTRMIVVSDGDVVRNQLDKDGRPMELGYDRWTGKLYGNKDFMMNCVNYLLDENGLITLRSKDVSLPLTDTKKVEAEYTRVQIITVLAPLLVLALFGIGFTLLRRRMYAR
ncbi:gliding motility-associated ABC transporter substrate-binding protein GldG [Flavobacterium sp. HJ-32-4]|uniref:gliding motility-associated ABC transporter substrate-binding protein GldG n=1 Tax=Flavobacterium sp. HJ-32-4 TaxID=1160795 RepID=UPI001F146187|nr:gliding motility-associated ABC transporter substrate-binding protein GldG [Flavobacterium sp. HJ-32-4]UMY64904.1 gliding motility-associated ABC transporter substrate-binding protein GldG [Flavobacterium sp. HJ-32-4]